MMMDSQWKVTQRMVKFIALIAVGLAVVACNGVKVKETTAPSKALSTAKYYAWQSEPVTSSPLMKGFDQAVRKAVDKQLQQRGYQLASDTAPDFYVDYRFTEIEASTADVGGSMNNGGWQHANDGMNFVGWPADPSMSEYPVGVLNLALLNPKNNAELWEIYGSKMLDEVRDLKNVEANVNRVVLKMFADFKRKAQ